MGLQTDSVWKGVFEVLDIDGRQGWNLASVQEFWFYSLLLSTLWRNKTVQARHTASSLGLCPHTVLFLWSFSCPSSGWLLPVLHESAGSPTIKDSLIFPSLAITLPMMKQTVILNSERKCHTQDRILIVCGKRTCPLHGNKRNSK